MSKQIQFEDIKKGMKVKVIDVKYGHEFPIGTEIKVNEVRTHTGDFDAEGKGKRGVKESWLLRPEEVESI